MKEPKSKELLPLNVIRTETVLSRFPIHRLSPKGNVSIDIRTLKPNGELKVKWKVSHNSEYGQPNALAYKLDTLIINRRIEEAGKPVPKLIRLGSLSEIAYETGTGSKNTNAIKKALMQNVGALITAKFTYKTNDGAERSIEIASTRYAVIFTGEHFPNGDKADATYIMLHDIYREILNTAPTRPLDYDYLKLLPPAAQRFYELVSFQMYSALKRKRLAKILYSEFCTYAPQTRYFDWEHVRKQMYKIHRPHLQSGYIENLQFEQLRGDDGVLDWMISYLPGKKAKGEHTLAVTKPLPRAKHIEKDPRQLPLIPDDPKPPLVPETEINFSPDEENLVTKLKVYGVSETKARSLVKTHRAAVERQLLAYPYHSPVLPKKNPAGWLIKAITENYDLPEMYVDAKEQEATKAKASERQKAEAVEQQKEAEKRKIEARAKAKFMALPEAERERMLAEKMEQIRNAPEWKGKNPKIINSVINGLAQSAIIEDFIKAAS